jgi:NAD(P)H-flavin reductase/ferredoxin
MFGLFGNKKKDHQAVVNNGAASFTVKAGENLLKAALEAGVAWPHDCRVGSCGTCKCVIKKGKIKALTDFSYVLDGDQLKAGTVLACQSHLRSDIEVDVELDEGAPKTEIVNLTGIISQVKDLTHDIKEITFKSETAFTRDMLAGQYAEIDIEGISKPRSYSFAKSPNNEAKDEFTFYVRLVPGGEFTEWLFQEDRVGTPAKLSAPFGQFYYRDSTSHMVCIAGGSGMSAIKSLLEECVEKQVKRNCIYLFGAREQKDLYCAEEMQKIAAGWNKDFTFTYVPVLSAEPEGTGWDGPTGYVTTHFQESYIDAGKIDLKDAQGYLCGPPAMIDSAVELLKAAGIEEDSIYFDKFLDASSIPGGR